MQQRNPAPAAPAQARQPHTLIVENRGSISATGVTRIVSCDENGAVLFPMTEVKRPAEMLASGEAA